jgi:hypothetical protein
MAREDRRVLGYWALAAVVLPLANPALVFLIVGAGLPWLSAVTLVVVGAGLLLAHVARKVWSKDQGRSWRIALGLAEAVAFSVLVTAIWVYIALSNCDGCLS